MTTHVLERYRHCQLNSAPRWDALNFGRYIEFTQALVTQCRLDLTPENSAKVIQANSAFELGATGKKSIGIILAHGLMDSPFTMRDLGDYFAKQDCLVRAVLLPGHGTRPGDLLNVTLQDWIDSVHFAIAQTRPCVEKLIVVGFSGGASIALLQALNNPHVDAIVALAPSLKLLNRAAALSGLLHIYGKYTGKAHWFSRQAELDYARYESFPANLARQAYRLTELTRKSLAHKTLNIPTQIIITQDDETVCSRTTLKYFELFTHPKNQLLLYTKHPEQYRGIAQLEARMSQQPQAGILDFSHISLPIAATNPHYGINGDLRLVTLEPNQPLHDSLIMRGAINKLNRQKHRLQRLTYNPDFDYMTQKIWRFIEALI